MRRLGFAQIINLSKEMKQRPKIYKDESGDPWIDFTIEHDSVMIDLGANVGFISGGWLDAIGKKVDIICFEPNPHAFKVLQEKFKYNSNVKCVVEMIDFCAFLKKLKEKRKVSFIKMDIEGGEVALLKELLDQKLLDDIQVTVEAHDQKMPELKEGTDALRERIEREGLTNIVLEHP